MLIDVGRAVQGGTKREQATPDYLLYDGECPFCSRYVALVAIRKLSPSFRLIDARQAPELVRELAAKGYDIDAGMVLSWKGSLYHGAEAMHVLGLVADSAGVFGVLNRAIFSSRRASRLLYPLLRGGRDLSLRLLGRCSMGSQHDAAGRR